MEGEYRGFLDKTINKMDKVGNNGVNMRLGPLVAYAFSLGVKVNRFMDQVGDLKQYDFSEYVAAKLSIQGIMSYLQTCEREANAVRAPAEQFTATTGFCPGVISEDHYVFKGVENSKKCPIVDGVIGLPNVNTTAALMADRRVYIEKRKEGRETNFPVPITFLSLPAIPLYKEDVFPPKMTEINKSSFLYGEMISSKGGYTNGLILEDQVAAPFAIRKPFPPETQERLNARLKIKDRVFYTLPKYKPPYLSYDASLSTIQLYVTDERHKKLRGMGSNGTAKVVNGYYIASMEKHVYTTMANVADVLSIANRFKLGIIGIDQYAKGFGTNWMCSLVANKLCGTVLKNYALPKHTDRCGIFRSTSMDLTNMLKVETDTLWLPPAVKVKAKNKYIEFELVDEDAERVIASFMKYEGVRIVKVPLRDVLSKYYTFLIPSSMPHRNEVWLCNKEVNVFESYQHAMVRCYNGMMAMTLFPFTRRPFIKDDDKYKHRIWSDAFSFSMMTTMGSDEVSSPMGTVSDVYENITLDDTLMIKFRKAASGREVVVEDRHPVRSVDDEGYETHEHHEDEEPPPRGDVDDEENAEEIEVEIEGQAEVEIID